MKARFGYSIAVMTFIVAIISACSVGNKVIPNPGGAGGVDTSNTTLNNFQIIVTGDTSFIMNITTVDTVNSIVDDSLLVAGIELNGSKVGGLMGFKTYGSNPNTYLTELSPPGITTAEFGIIKEIKGSSKIFTMQHGNITITEHNAAEKTVKGSFDVNNEFNTAGLPYLRCRGSFYIRYQ